MAKRVLLLALVLALAFTLVTGLSPVIAEGESEAPLQIRYAGVRYVPTQKTEYIRMLEEKLNVEFTLEGAYDTEYSEKLNLWLAAYDMPDVFQTWWNEQVMLQGTAEITVDEITEFMPEYMANISAICDELGMSLEGQLERFSRNGKLVQIPAIWYGGQFPSGIMWRTDILDQLGMEIPTTIDEWEAVFKAYKAQWPDKYPYAGCTGTQWQSFSAVFYSTGIVDSHWNLTEDGLRPGHILPQIRDALEVLVRWQAEGYIHPEWVTWDQPTKNNYFYNGEALVTDWFGVMPVENPLPGSAVATTLAQTPEAKLAYGPIPQMYPDVKPAHYVWNPFNGGATGFGVHLENDRDKLHKVMEVIHRLGWDEEVYVLAQYGVEGETFEWDPDYDYKLPKMMEHADTADEQTNLGIGYYWGTLCGMNLSEVRFTNPRTLEARQEYHLAPGALYSKDNILWHMSKVDGALTDPNGELISERWAGDSGTDWNTIMVEIITGQKDITAWDDFVEYWMAHGGSEYIEAADRLFLPRYQ